MAARKGSGFPFPAQLAPSFRPRSAPLSHSPPHHPNCHSEPACGKQAEQADFFFRVRSSNASACAVEESLFVFDFVRRLTTSSHFHLSPRPPLAAKTRV